MHMLLHKVQMPGQTTPRYTMVLGTQSTCKPPVSPNPNLKVQIIEFTYCDDRFPMEAISRKLGKYAILEPL